MPLTNRQVRYLRGLGHHLHPVVTVAEKGLTSNVLREVEAALKKHELIKVRLRADKSLRREWVEGIADHCGAERIQLIGQVACFYKRNRQKPVIALPENA